jgi:hypothetical protein
MTFDTRVNGFVSDFLQHHHLGTVWCPASCSDAYEWPWLEFISWAFEVNMNPKLAEKAAYLKEKHHKIGVPVPPGWGCAKGLNLIHVK